MRSGSSLCLAPVRNEGKVRRPAPWDHLGLSFSALPSLDPGQCAISAAAPRSRAPGGACVPEWAALRVSAQGLPASPLLTCNWQNKSQATSDLQGQESSDPRVRKEARCSTLTCPPLSLFEMGQLQGGGRGWVLCSELSAPLEVSVGSNLWSTEGISLASSLRGRGALAQCSAPLHRGQSRAAGGLRE